MSYVFIRVCQHKSENYLEHLLLTSDLHVFANISYNDADADADADTTEQTTIPRI